MHKNVHELENYEIKNLLVGDVGLGGDALLCPSGSGSEMGNN